jgi:hypothetical protein
MPALRHTLHVGDGFRATDFQQSRKVRYSPNRYRVNSSILTRLPFFIGASVQQMQICTEAQMSIQIERQNTHAFLASVSCLRCEAPMTIKTIEPSMSAPSHDEIVYRCPACQLERKQSVMRAD